MKISTLLRKIRVPRKYVMPLIVLAVITAAIIYMSTSEGFQDMVNNTLESVMRETVAIAEEQTTPRATTTQPETVAIAEEQTTARATTTQPRTTTTTQPRTTPQMPVKCPASRCITGSGAHIAGNECRTDGCPSGYTRVTGKQLCKKNGYNRTCTAVSGTNCIKNNPVMIHTGNRKYCRQ